MEADHGLPVTRGGVIAVVDPRRLDVVSQLIGEHRDPAAARERIWHMNNSLLDRVEILEVLLQTLTANFEENDTGDVSSQYERPIRRLLEAN